MLPVVICQSQYLAASKCLMCSTSQLPLKNSSRQRFLAKIRVHQPSLSFAQEGFLPGYWSPSENPTTKRPNPTSELCVDEEQSTSEAHAKASIHFFMEFPTPWKINIKQTQKWKFGSNMFKHFSFSIWCFLGEPAVPSQGCNRSKKQAPSKTPFPPTKNTMPIAVARDPLSEGVCL